MPASAKQIRIKALRLALVQHSKALGYSHSEIAQAMKTTQGTVNQWAMEGNKTEARNDA